ncbi:MAG: V-type ATP synthase subunit D [Ardenticatenaceae bacterium]|nr:V-type ATP synthase subunit D [Ardenticatenaceae bacterium]HBY96904.1 V-type ATP synthase subunit D [Chloroflexota bacterium]
MEGTRPELLKVPPTRSNLLRLREELDQAREGYDLLQRKREVLARELLEMIDDAEAVEREARLCFQTAYEVLQEARMSMGVERLHWIGLARGGEVNAQVAPRSVMGVAVPIVQVEVTALPLPYGLGDTSASLDEARERWREVAELLGHLAEAVTTAWRLAVELRKTQRRVNALEHNFIPQYEATLHAIAQVLEEQEREAFVHAKRVKARRGVSPEEAHHD